MHIIQDQNFHSPHGLRGLLFDLGDTLMWETTENKDQNDVTIFAELLPGASQLIQRLRAEGYWLGLVADSHPRSPLNVLEQHRLLHLFDTASISEIVGVSKPDKRMFLSALLAMDIPETEFPRVAMIGNNLERDIVGAKALGLITIFIHSNDRRRAIPIGPEETPDYTVRTIPELSALIDRIDQDLTNEIPGGS